MADAYGLRFRALGIAVLGCIVLSGRCWGQTPSPTDATATAKLQGQFVNRVLTDATGDHKYVVFVPANYSPDKPTPTILFLHGAVNRGNDGRSQLVSGLAPAIRLQLESYPFLVVFPQCENTFTRVLGGWTEAPQEADRALKMLDAVEQDYNVDKSRESLVGLSMGGCGVWELAARTPDRWAAIVPVSAMGKPDKAEKLAKIPTWVFHATSDPLVPTHVAENMVTAIRNAGGRAYFSVVTKRGHDLSNVVFTQKALSDWLLDPSKEPKLDLEWVEPAGYSSGHELEVPFVPGAEISKAIRFRLCKDVLQAVALALPEKFADKPMTGYAPSMHQSATVGGFLPINVALTGLHYQGHVEQLRFFPQAPDRLILQAGLRNVTMTVSNSQLSGKLLFSASAGPMNVVIGHRAPVWLTVAVRPRVENRQLKLDVVGTDFQIPPDNWYVTEPNGVSVRGMPFLNGKVSSGLVEGVYSHKNEIERQVLSNVPNLIQNLEHKLNTAISGKTLMIGQISMPIWQPRMRTYPEEVLIDDDGMTLVSGAVMCALGRPPKDFKMRTYEAKTSGEPERIKTGMEIGISESVVPAWSELITAGRVNRFNVYDFTPVEYHVLADPDFLQDAIPELKKYGTELEANVDFQLRDPIRLLNPSPSAEPARLEEPLPGRALTLSLSSVPLTIAVRRRGETEWTTVGELDLRIDRDYAPYMRKSSFVHRGPKFAETSPFRITSNWTFAPGYEPENRQVNTEKIVAQVLVAREAAQLLEGVKPDSVQDIKLAGVPLRMDALNWDAEHMVIQFQIPGIVVINDSKEPLTYEVRGPMTGWCQPRTLAPGEHDEYRVPYPLTWRHQLPTETQFYTLPLGKEFSYRNDPKPSMVTVKYEDELHEEAIVPR